MLLYHAPRDELVPFELGVALRDEWCGRGVNVRLREISGAVDHSVTATALGNLGAIDWLGERFATGPPPQPDECRMTAARRRARTRLRFGFPGGPWRHVMPRYWHVHARARGGLLRGLVFAVRDGRGRLVGRSARRPLHGRRHAHIELRRKLRPGRRYRVIATARRTDGSRLRKRLVVRMPGDV